MNADGNYGWGRLEIDEYEFLKVLEAWSPEIQARARKALGDLLGGRHCAYDPLAQRAFCFQRRGLAFTYQFWNSVFDREAAQRLFSEFPTGDLPFPPDVADRLYRHVTGD